MEVIYPKDEPERKDPHLERRWVVAYEDLVCEGAGCSTWVKGYRTKTGARFAAWFWYHIGTYGGGTVSLHENHRP